MGRSRTVFDRSLQRGGRRSRGEAGPSFSRARRGSQTALGEAKVVDESSGIEVGRELKIPHQRARIVRRGLTPIAQLMRGSAAQPLGLVIRWRRRTR